MTTLKKALALLVAFIMAFSCVSVMASADEPDTLTIKTSGLANPTEDTDVAKAKRGSTVNVYISIGTNYDTRDGGELIFAYNRDFAVYQHQARHTLNNNNPAVKNGYIDYIGTDSELSVGHYKRDSEGNKTDEWNHGFVATRLNKQGLLTDSDLEQYGFFIVQLNDVLGAGKRQYDGSTWLFAAEFEISKDADPNMIGEMLKVQVLPSTIQSPTNQQGIVNIPKYMPSSNAVNGMQNLPNHVVSPTAAGIQVINDVYFFEGDKGEFDSKVELDDATGAYKAVSYVGEEVAFSALNVPTPEGKQDVPDPDDNDTLKDYVFSNWLPADSSGKATSSEPATSVTVPAGDPAYFVANYTEGDTYKITYKVVDENGNAIDEEESSASYAEGDEIAATDLPADEGYEYSDWTYTKEDGTVIDTLPDEMPAYNIIATTTKTPIDCYVTFDANGGTAGAKSEKTVKYGAPITSDGIDVPTRTGYKHIGWSVNAGENNSVTSLGTMDNVQGKTVYAVWQIKTYTVTWQVGDKTYTTEATYGQEIPEPPVSDELGYELSDWSPEVPKAMPDKEDLKFTATQNPKDYYVTFDANDGAFSDDTTSKKVASTFDQKINLPEKPANEGHTFLGWSLQSNAKTGSENLGELKTTEPLTYYAIWEAKTYTVIWTIDGESTTTTDTYGEALHPPVIPNKPGYDSGAWTPGVPGTMPDVEDLEFKSVSTPKVYNITFDANDGAFSDNTTSKGVESTFGQKINLPEEPANEGHTFLGWALESNSKVGSKNLGELKTTEPLTYYAVWSPNNNAVRIEYYSKGTDGEYVSTGTETTSGETGTTVNITKQATDETPEGFVLDTTMSKLSDTVPATGTLTLKVYYDRNKYNVTFDPNGGYLDGDTSKEAEVVENLYFGATITSHTANKEGCEEGTWTVTNTNTGATITEIPTKVPAYNITFTANYEAIKTTVTFDPNGGNFPEGATTSKTLEYNDAINADGITTPVLEGYKHIGWAKTADAKTPEDLGTVKDQPITVYAVWEANKYKVIFDANNGSFPEGATSSKDVPYGERIDADSITEPGRTGYKFLGWSTDANAKIPGDLGTMGSGAKTVYAVWELQEYVANFDPNGGTFEEGAQTTKNVKYGKEITTDGIATPTAPAGKEFAGWALSKNATQADASLGNMTEEGVTVYAVWKTKSYPATFDANGGKFDGDATTEIKYVEYGTEINSDSISTPANEGFELLGWSTNKDATTPDTSLGNMTENGATVYAVWKGIEKTVTFDANGGEFADGATTEKTYAYGEEMDVAGVSVPEKEGYEFLGWSFDKDAETADTDKGSGSLGKVTDKEAKTAYAVWKAVDVDVTFDANGGEFADGSDKKDATAPYGSDPSEVYPTENPTKPGKSFIGWVDENGNTVDKIDDVDGLKLFAKWGDVKYTVTYYYDRDNDGEPDEYKTQEYNYGDTITLPANPDIDGFEFVGWEWYTSNNEESKISKPETMPEQNLIVLATWEAKTYKVTFTLNGGKWSDGSTADKVIEVKFGDEIARPETPEKSEEELFSHWKQTKGKDAEVGGKMPASDVTFEAQWGDPKEYTITYVIYGDIIETSGYYKGETIFEKEDPTRFGFTFKGWKWYNSDGDHIAEPSEMPGEDLRAEAQWEFGFDEVPEIDLPNIDINTLVIDPQLYVDLVDAIIGVLPDKLPEIDFGGDGEGEGETTDKPDGDGKDDGKDDGKGNEGSTNVPSVDIPDTGSAAGIAVFAIISGAAATAYVIKRKKDND